MSKNLEIVEVCPLFGECDVPAPYSGRAGEELCPLFVLAAQRWIAKNVTRNEVDLPAIVDCPKVDELLEIC